MSTAAESIRQTKDRVVDAAAGAAHQGAVDIKRVVKDIEELLERVAKLDDPKIAGLRERLEDSLESAKTSAMQTASRLRRTTMAVAGSTDDFVHERPWAVAGIAAIAGLALGAALFRR